MGAPRIATAIHRSRRRLLLVGAAGVLVLVGARGLAVLGWWTPILVVGPSMSPTLWGPSHQAHCDACGWSHRVHHAPHPRGRQLRCFRCGQLSLQVDPMIHAGDRVLLDRAAYLRRNPRRGELVAAPRGDGGFQVKRVIGLPGETVAIDGDGQWLIDQRPWVPHPEDAWRRSVEVYHCENLRNVPPRWRTFQSVPTERAPHRVAVGPQEDANAWQFDHATNQFQWSVPASLASSPGTDPSPWLVYHHINVHDDGRSDCIRDDNPANAALTRQPLPVSDFRLAFDVKLPRPGNLLLAFWDDRAGGVGFGCQTRLVMIPLAAGRTRVAILRHAGATIQLLPRVDGDPANLQHQSPESCSLAAAADEEKGADTPSPRLDDRRPVAICIDGVSSADINHLWLGRSVRYDPPLRLAARWQRGVLVPAGHLLICGDNPTNSDDSRSDPDGVPIRNVLGRVIPWSAGDREETTSGEITAADSLDQLP